MHTGIIEKREWGMTWKNSKKLLLDHGANYLKVRFSLFFFSVIIEPDVVLCVHPLLAFNLPQSSSTAGGCPCEWTRENSLNLFLSVRMSSLHVWSRVLCSVLFVSLHGETWLVWGCLKVIILEQLKRSQSPLKMSEKGVSEEENI